MIVIGGADQKPMSKASDGVSVENADEFAAQSCDNGGMDIGFKGSQKEESQVLIFNNFPLRLQGKFEMILDLENDSFRRSIGSLLLFDKHSF